MKSGSLPPATVSVDLDDCWTYLKSRAAAGWDRYPSYLDRAVPRLLDLLAGAGLKATFFVVGRDATDPRQREWLRVIAAAGHEVANHSFSHETWLAERAEGDVRDELIRAEEAIGEVTGVRPIGFRGPGFSLSGVMLETLAARGYAYDASTWPTVVMGAARWYLFLKTGMNAAERQRRSRLGGGMGDAFRPLRPYRWRTGSGSLLELPVTTFPGLRLPLHPSFLQVAAGLSPRLAEIWFQLGLQACRFRDVAPSVLFHPTDVLGKEDADAPDFIPGVRVPLAEKLRRAAWVLARLREGHEVLTLGGFAHRLDSVPLAERMWPRSASLEELPIPSSHTS